MAWNTDKEPIEYLRQRIRYYKKKQSKIEKLINDPYMVQQYGDDLPYIIGRRLLTISSYIDMFTKAVKNLQDIESEENLIH